MGKRDSYRWNPLHEGNIEGRKFVVETHFAARARTIPLTRYQREMVIGSILGDGTLAATTSGYCFRVHHGVKQTAYVDWKYQVLESHVRSAPRISGNGYYFRTVTHPEFSDLRGLFYRGKRKIVPAQSVGLTPFGLAVWVMDDGALEGRQLRLNTQSFSLEENEELTTVLRAKFGLDVRLNQDKGKYRLRFTAASMPALIEIVRPHIHPSMLYKLPL